MRDRDQAVTDTDLGGDESVTLDGSGSTDSDGTIASYVWTESAVQIATGVSPAVVFDVGVHTVTLTVTDNDGATDTDNVIITVNAGSLPISYATDIQPYFNSRCTSCHSGSNPPKGVDLASWAGVLAGGKNDPLVVPFNSSDPSAVLVPQMEDGHEGAPHGTNIIQDIKDWIDAGALDN